MAQPPIDSLLVVLKEATHDTVRLKTLIHLSWQSEIYRKVSDIKKYADQAMVLVNDIESKGILSNHILKFKANSYLYLGKYYSHVANFQEAFNNYDLAEKLYKQIENKSGTAFIVQLRASVFLTQGKYDEALKLYRTSMKIREEINDKQGIASCYTNMGLIYQNTQKYKEAEVNFLKALELFRQIGDKNFEPIVLTNLANNYALQSEFLKALKIYQEYWKLAEERNNKSSMNYYYTNVGRIYFLMGDNLAALNNYFKAVKLTEELADQQVLATVYENIGEIYEISNELHKAFDYYILSKKIWESLGNKSRIARTLKMLGTVYRKLKEFEKALDYLDKSRELYLEMGSQAGISDLYVSLGEVLYDQGKFHEALDNHLIALRFYEEKSFRIGVAQQLANVGSSLIKLNRVQAAKDSIRKAITISKELGTVVNMVSFYKYLQEADSILGNFKEAYENHKLHIFFRDSMTNAGITRKLIQNQMQHDFDRKEDSLKYEQLVIAEKLKQRDLLTEQQKHELLLKQKELQLASQENEIQKLAFLQSQSDLALEQEKRTVGDRQLKSIEQEKKLQESMLNLQNASLQLQARNIREKKNQRNLFIAGTMTFLILSFFVYRNFSNQRKANRLEKKIVEKEKSELQLQSLRAQLNPHFMFNSLNAIQALIIRQENDSAQIYLERFARLLRLMLENADQPFVPLRKELHFLDLYLSLEKLRIPELEYKVNLHPDVNTDQTFTPNMMLQPYLENALWHGLQHTNGPKILDLSIRKSGDKIIYIVKDNGVGRQKSSELKSQYQKGHTSKGMELLSKRFSLLSKEFGEEIQAIVTDITEEGECKGTEVTISIPVALANIHKVA